MKIERLIKAVALAHRYGAEATDTLTQTQFEVIAGLIADAFEETAPKYVKAPTVVGSFQWIWETGNAAAERGMK